VESGDLRGLWSGARQCQASVVSASPTTSRSVGSSLRPPRPSTVTGPGPSRTWSGGRIGVQAPFIGLRIVTTLLRSVRTTAGSLAAHRLEPKLRPGDQDPASPGVRDLSAPPPTHPTRIHSQEPELPRVPFGPTAPPVQLPFRPRGFAPPRRLSPREGPWACCIPLPILRFIGFPRRARRASVLPGLPRRCHTLQSLLHPYSRTRVTASRCPLVVSRLRSPVPPGPVRLQGLAPYEQCVAMVRRCRQAKARCSPGLPVLEHHDCRPIMAPGGRSRRRLRARTLSGDRA
jgi:hypothetical protein